MKHIFRALVWMVAVVGMTGRLLADDPAVDPRLERAGTLNDYTDIDFHGGDFDGKSFVGAPLVRARLSKGSFKNCNFAAADFADADVAGADFSGADLSSARLAGVKHLWLAKLDNARLADLTGVDLHGANLTVAQLDGIQAYGANLSNADLTGTSLSHAHFIRANLTAAKLAHAAMDYADCRLAKLQAADLSQANLNLTAFNSANLAGAIGVGTAEGTWRGSADTQLPPGIDKPPIYDEPYTADQLAGEDYSSVDHDLTQIALAGKDLHGKSLTYCQLPVDLTNINFNTAKLTKCLAVGANFSGTDLGSVDFTSAVLANADLSRARQLGRADFTQAYLEGAKFTHADAAGIVLQDAYLLHADFSGANLGGANLRHTNLQRARFFQADLSGADLSDADVTDADFTAAKLDGVNLTLVIGLTNAQLAKAASYDRQSLPPRMRDMPTIARPGFAGSSKSGAAAMPDLPDGAAWPNDAPVLDHPPAVDGEELPPVFTRHVKWTARRVGLMMIPALASLLLLRVMLSVGAGLVAAVQGDQSPAIRRIAGTASGTGGADAAQAPPPSGNPVGRAIVAIFKLSVLFTGLGMFYFNCVVPTKVAASSAGWTRTPCLITVSESVMPGDDDDTFFPWRLNYRYRDPQTHQPRQGSRFNFNPRFTFAGSDHPSVSSMYAVGTRTYCWVDPRDSSTAVLQRSVGHAGASEGVSLGLIGFGLYLTVGRLLAPRGIVGVPQDHLNLLDKSRINQSGLPLGYPPPPAVPGPVSYRSTELRLSQYAGMLRAALFVATVAVTVGMGLCLFGGHGWVWLTAGIPGVIAFFMILAVFRRLKKLTAPAVELVLARPLQPGKSVDLQWALTGNAGAVDALNIAMVGHEEATYRRGTDTVTDRRALPDEPLLQVGNAGRLRQGKSIISLGLSHMHTFTAKNNVLRWELKVEIATAAGNVQDLFPVIIYPAGAIK
jgi:uncharacterized protein YjbI with pentapeptide repeats